MKSSISSTCGAGFLPIIFLCVGTILISGCSTPAQSSAMAIAPQTSLHGSSEFVSIDVSGGGETSATGTSQISNEDFRNALEQSIHNSRVFAGIKEPSDSSYKLEAHIGMLSQPMMGFSMTVSLEVYYRLTDLRDSTVIFERNIETVHTASAGTAFAAVTRIRMATEGAAKESILEMLEAVAALGLD